MHLQAVTEETRSLFIESVIEMLLEVIIFLSLKIILIG